MAVVFGTVLSGGTASDDAGLAIPHFLAFVGLAACL